MKHGHFFISRLLLGIAIATAGPSVAFPADPADPVATLTAPAKSAPACPVLLGSAGSSASSLTWLHFPEDPTSVFIPLATADGESKALFFPSRPGTHTFVLIAVRADRIAVTSHVLTVEASTPPEPPKPPTPIRTGKYWPVIIHESADTTPAQAAVITSATAREYLASKKHHAPFLIDKDATDENDKQPPAVREYVKRAPSLPFVFLVAEDGTVLAAAPLPADETSYLQFLKSVGDQ